MLHCEESDAGDAHTHTHTHTHTRGQGTSPDQKAENQASCKVSSFWSALMRQNKNSSLSVSLLLSMTLIDPLGCCCPDKYCSANSTFFLLPPLLGRFQYKTQWVHPEETMWAAAVGEEHHFGAEFVGVSVNGSASTATRSRVCVLLSTMFDKHFEYDTRMSINGRRLSLTRGRQTDSISNNIQHNKALIKIARRLYGGLTVRGFWSSQAQ